MEECNDAIGGSYGARKDSNCCDVEQNANDENGMVACSADCASFVEQQQQKENETETTTTTTMLPPPMDASQGKVQRYIRSLSIKQLSSYPFEISVDQKRLDGILEDVLEYSYGIAGVEVYSFEDPRLVPVAWRFENDCCDESTNRNVPLEEGEPEICIPGVDLVGTLWQQASTTITSSNVGGMKRVPSLSSLQNSRSWSSSFRQQKVVNNTSQLPIPFVGGGGTSAAAASGGGRLLQWRDLKSIMEDPDTIHGDRLEALINAGFERAAGIGFDSCGTQGMVVYYARTTGVNTSLLFAVANETFLSRTASLVGSILTMSESRRASLAFQQQSRRGGDDDFDLSLSSNHHRMDKVTLHTAKHNNNRPNYTVWLRNRLVAWCQKSRGGGSQIPPGMTVVESLWTIVGVLVGMLTISSMNKLFQFVSDTEYFVVMAPFGALMTLQYGLTAAPAAQPRNCIFGNVVAGAISFAFTYIPESILPIWIRTVVACAFSVGAMVFLGITHPPAGAFSVIFAQGRHDWGFYAIAVLCSFVSIIPATLVNNMSHKRQYPTYWGLVAQPSCRWRGTCCCQQQQLPQTVK